MWDESLQTVALMGLSVLLCVFFGVILFPIPVFIRVLDHGCEHHSSQRDSHCRLVVRDRNQGDHLQEAFERDTTKVKGVIQKAIEREIDFFKKDRLPKLAKLLSDKAQSASDATNDDDG